MRPVLPTILCCGLVTAFFMFDRETETDGSFPVWVSTIWFMIISSRMVSLWFGAGGARSVDVYLEGNPVDRNIFLVLIVLSGYMLLKRGYSFSEFYANNKVLTILLIYSLISIAWSDFPFVSFKRWIKSLGNILTILLLLTSQDPTRSVVTVLRRASFVLIPFSIVLIKYYPKLGRVYHRYSGELTITGVAMGKNALGVMCMVLGLFLLWMLRGKLKTRNIMSLGVITTVFLMDIYLLFTADSATAIVCFFLGMLFLPLSWSGYRRYLGTVNRWAAITLVAVIVILNKFFNFSTTIIESLGRDPTLTGRVVLWDELLGYKKNIILGYGYDSFWLGDRIAALWDKYWWMPTEAHNGFLETYLELGLIGLFLLGLLIFSVYPRVFSAISARDGMKSLFLTFFLISIVYNIAESAFKGVHIVWYIFLLSIISVSIMVEAESPLEAS
ncbi:MAG: O-antigen ligase family protein [bacterium]|nr:O-antigen ligase family protein [bacterium]